MTSLDVVSLPFHTADSGSSEDELTELAFEFAETGIYETQGRTKIEFNTDAARVAYINAGYENSYDSTVQAGDTRDRRWELKK